MIRCTDQNNAKTTLLLAVAAKPEVQKWRWPKKTILWACFPNNSIRQFSARTHRFATIQNVTYRQTEYTLYRRLDRYYGPQKILVESIWRFQRTLIIATISIPLKSITENMRFQFLNCLQGCISSIMSVYGTVLPHSRKENVCVGAGRRGVLRKELRDSQIYGSIHA